jgi:CheY-like chemotaxis protein/signal transduction histidine kinase/HAMP domain-containing protein
MVFRNISIAKRLLLGFGIILLLQVASSVLSFFDIDRLWNQTDALYKHPFIVSNAARDININILNIRRNMLDIAISPSREKVEQYQKSIDLEEQNALIAFDTIKNQYLGDKRDIDALYNYFINWKAIREKAFQEITSDKYDLATALIINQNKAYVDSLLLKSQVVIDFASLKAESFYQNAIDTQLQTKRTMILISIIALLVGILFASVLTRSITKPLSQIVEKIREIAIGTLGNEKLPVYKDEVGLLAYSYNQMHENLVHKATIARRIAQGVFNQRVQTSGESDVVANSINQIADNFELVIKQARLVASGVFETELTGLSESNQLVQVINQMLDSLKTVVSSAQKVAEGDYDGEIIPRSKSDELAHALNRMTKSLREVTRENARQNRLMNAQNELNEKMRGEHTPEGLAKNIVTYLSKFTKAQIGAFYLFNSELESYLLTASYAFKMRKGYNTGFKPGEGLVGQAALEKEIISFSNVPDDYIHVTSGIGDTVPRYILVAPLTYNDITLGVIELGSVDIFSQECYDFMNMVTQNVAIAVNSAIKRNEIAKLLSVTKEQAEELQVQQEELRQTNEELEAQTKTLKKSEEFLQTQQEELRVTNEELEEKTRYLEQQKSWMEKQNDELRVVRFEMEKKAKELEITNKYKSEFLANMSHELRTPLNSLLILSQNLAENRNKNLTSDQVDSLNIIYNSGSDLLNLINDILDLSKIESGKVTLSYSPVNLRSLGTSLNTFFHHMIEQKKIAMHFDMEENIPDEIPADEQKLNQVLRNLIGNAIKFTSRGSVSFKICRPPAETKFSSNTLTIENTLAFSVKDTGIGISPEKQTEIFEAFQQADGSISRNYGGTGLGLTITRELTRLMGGEIHLVSEPGVGSEFTVYLPVKQVTENIANSKVSIAKTDKQEAVAHTKIARPHVTVESTVTDDRETLEANENTMLIIEDDQRFAKILAALCHEKGFKCLVTPMGEEAIDLAAKYIPKGIILDLNLPGIDGWEVMQKIKNTPETRHIPVHIMSAFEESIEAYNRGAIGYLTKPATREALDKAFSDLESFISKEIKDLLIIEDDPNLLKSIRTLLSSSDINITECSRGMEAIKKLTSTHYDCVVLDLGLPDITGFDLLKKLTEKNIKVPPVVVYTGKDLTSEESNELQKYTRNIIIKGVKSQERLLDETSLFLHRMVENMPENQKKMLVNLYDKEKIFIDKKVLIVDDDMRNVFALTQVLESAKMKVLVAQNGQKAIDQLDKIPDMDLVLMDIMMPVMDGLEAMRRIRKDKRFKKLPIIAITAKAMKEDRLKSMEAGANDYLSKPVDIQKLLNLLQIWLYQ